MKNRLGCLLVLALSLAAAGRAFGVAGVDLAVTRYAIESGIFNVIFAKELCSCVYLDGLTADECKARDNLPAAAHSLVTIKFDDTQKTVTSKFNLLIVAAKFAGFHAGPKAAAKFIDERQGCVVTAGPAG